MPRVKATTVKSAQPEQASAHSKEIVETLLAVRETSIGGRDCLSVRASDLHASLQVGRDYTNWIKEKIKKYQFDENVDYTWEIVNDSGENLKSGGRRKHEYLLSLGMAKELAMLQNNQQGRIARKYFIECEDRYRDSQFQIAVATIKRAAQETYTKSEVENRLKVVSKILRTSWYTACKAYGQIIGKLAEDDHAGRKAARDLTKSIARKAAADIEAQIEKVCQGMEAAECSDEWREQIIAAIDQHSQTSGA